MKSTLTRTVKWPRAGSGVNDADVLNDTLLLVSAIEGATRLGDQLHAVDLQSVRIVRSFFSPPVPQGMEAAFNMVTWSAAAIRGDTIAAVFSASDTVYVMDVAGRVRERVAIPSQHFRPIERLPADFRTNPRAQKDVGRVL